MKRILLGQLGANGDCLYATIVARQIKEDFPGCHLTWAVGTYAKTVLHNNPYVDDVWEFDVVSWDQMQAACDMFESEALRLQCRGVYDHVFNTQISPNLFANFDGTIRPSILRGYPTPITVPIENVIRLTESETASVDRWYAQSPASEASQAVFFECSSKSGQSFMTPDLAVAVSERVLAQRPKLTMILSTHAPIPTGNKGIVWANALSIRETMRLTHHVDLFVGCGSGLTVAATSEGANHRLPNIQVLDKKTSVYASFRHDFEYFGKSSDRFMELLTSDPDQIARVILSALTEGFPSTKAQFDDPIPLHFDFYLMQIDSMLVRRGMYVDAANSLRVTAERYGVKGQLKEYAEKLVTPLLRHDPRYRFVERRSQIERYRALFC